MLKKETLTHSLRESTAQAQVLPEKALRAGLFLSASTGRGNYLCKKILKSIQSLYIAKNLSAWPAFASFFWGF
jgi:hypothetical protein